MIVRSVYESNPFRFEAKRSEKRIDDEIRYRFEFSNRRFRHPFRFRLRLKAGKRTFRHANTV